MRTPRRRTLELVLLLTSIGCGTPQGNNDAADVLDASSEVDGPASPPDAAGYDLSPACVTSSVVNASIDYALPAIGQAGTRPFPSTAGSSYVSAGDTIQFTTTDLDGDRRPDLVITSQSNDPSVGTSRWLVFKNTGSGFAATPLSFALPDVGAVGPFVAFPFLSGLGKLSAAQSIQFRTLDLDGDGRLDLAVTGITGDGTLGSTRWSVFKNLGTGFASTGTDHALPSVGQPGYQPFASVTEIGPISASDRIVFATFDADGDHLPDLVITSQTNDLSIGTSKWRVFKNNGSGFSATATEFALPAVGAASASVPFPAVVGPGKLNDSDKIQFRLVDLDGDAKPDLVVTGKSNDAAVGSAKWLVFRNLGTGFAASGVDHALPNIGQAGSQPFVMTAGTGSVSATDTIQFSTIDVDSDHRPDLVVTSQTGNPTIGTAKWIVYKNSGSGFMVTPTDFALPDVHALGSYVPFPQISGPGKVDGPTTIQSRALDLDADGALDLVITSKSNDVSYGSTQWVVFRGQCN